MDLDQNYYVYILRCRDGSYYVGHTNNLERRVSEHCHGIDSTCYTYLRRPLELVFSHKYQSRMEAFIMERRIKPWSRKKKEALINGNYTTLKQSAKKKFI